MCNSPGLLPRPQEQNGLKLHIILSYSKKEPSAMSSVPPITPIPANITFGQMNASLPFEHFGSNIRCG
jgi:hypothetical protein